MASREPTTVYRFPDWEIYYGPSSSLELHLPSPLLPPGQFCTASLSIFVQFLVFLALCIPVGSLIVLSF